MSLPQNGYGFVKTLAEVLRKRNEEQGLTILMVTHGNSGEFKGANRFFKAEEEDRRSMSILQYGFMQRAFLVGILLAVITPCIGITIVLKRMSMIGDALSHSSLAGVVLGLILGVNPVAGAVVMCIVAALGIEAIRKKSRVIRRWRSPSSCLPGSDWPVCCPALWKTVPV